MNSKYEQVEGASKKESSNKNIKVRLQANQLIDFHYKRYFQCWEILGGAQLIKFTGVYTEAKQ